MIYDPRDEEFDNWIIEIAGVKPAYAVKKNRRELNVLCFTEGKVILHGHYDYNYSFCYIDIARNMVVSDLINTIFSGEWEHFYSYMKLKRVYDENSAYCLKYLLYEGKITQYSSSVIYEPMGTLANDESVGRVIDKAIKDVYTQKNVYDENQVRAKLIDMKKIIAESEDLLFEKEVLPLERELSRMQYLLFGSKQIRELYIECRKLTASKYNAYMTLVR